MAKNENIQVRISADDKEQAKELYARYGLNLSAAINLFIQRSLQEGRLPFSLEETTTPPKSRLRRARRVQNI